MVDPAAPAPLYQLRVLEPDADERIVIPDVTPFVVGREDDCDLGLGDAQVSRHHMQLEVQPDGRIVVRDLGSANGTFIDTDRVVDGAWLGLPATIHIGKCTVIVEAFKRPVAATVIADPVAIRPVITGTVPSLEPPLGTGAGHAEPADGSGPMADAAPAPVERLAPVASALVEQVAPPTPVDEPSTAASPGAKASPDDAGRAVALEKAVRDVPRYLRWIGVFGVVTGLLVAVIGILLAVSNRRGSELGPFLALGGGINVAIGTVELVVARRLKRPDRRAWQVAMGLTITIVILSGINFLTSLASGATSGLFFPVALMSLGLAAVAALYRSKSWHEPG